MHESTVPDALRRGYTCSHFMWGPLTRAAGRLRIATVSSLLLFVQVIEFVDLSFERFRVHQGDLYFFVRVTFRHSYSSFTCIAVLLRRFVAIQSEIS